MAGNDKSEQPAKRKRVRACDQCRRRKVRCDGSEAEERACSNCGAFGYVCTYITGLDKPHIDLEYVRSLESEVTRLRLLVQKLQTEPCPKCASTDVRDIASPSSSAALSTPILSTSGIEHPDADQDSDGDEVLIEGFRSLSMDSKPYHFLGRSSSFTLIKAARNLKHELVGGPEISTHLDAEATIRNHRPEFWELAMAPVEPDPPYTNFPDRPLMAELVDAYFRWINSNFPLLHRPTFERGIQTGLHLRDEGFGATVLLVCALSARHLSDPSVIPDGAPNWHWAGWRWFQPVRARRKLVPLLNAQLYDLQVAALAAAYVGSSPLSHSSYAIIGHGIRIAQDLGAHRRTTYPSTPTVESELRKRAFWLLVALDRGMCSVLGRPCSIQEEDFDVDPPLECDDEYWENDDLQLAFKQPPEKPSTISFFNCMLRLVRIHTYALRSMYSLRSPKVLSDPQRAQEIVSELDSELNKWMDSIPEHLKWDPHQPDDLRATQSTSLFAAYYAVRIIIHRPFIPMPRKPSPLPFPSLAICTNAARSCIQVLDRYFARFGPVFVHSHHQLTLFTAAIILLLNIWGRSRAGSSVDAAKEMEEVHKALRMFQALEVRWNSAGRFWDILHDLVTAVDPAQQQGAPRVLKRRRDDDASQDISAFSTAVSPGSSHATAGPQWSAGPSSSSALPRLFHDFSPPTRTSDPPPGATDFNLGGLWQAFGAQPDAGAQQPLMPVEGVLPVDPDLEAIFADLLPTSSYEDPFAVPLYPNQFFSGAAPEPPIYAPTQAADGTPPMWYSGPPAPS